MINEEMLFSPVCCVVCVLGCVMLCVYVCVCTVDGGGAVQASGPCGG